jgi:SAM-dependent methyltransferase
MEDLAARRPETQTVISLSPNAESQCCNCGPEASSTVHLAYPDRPEWDIIRCDGCGLMRLRQFPNDEQVRAFYQQQYYRGSDASRFPGPIERVIRWFRLGRARLVHRLLGGRGAVLDVGCGRGLILAELQRRGYQVAGTQLSQTAAEVIRRQHGIPIHLGELPDAAYPADHFDMVILLHVLEHTSDPLLYLREIARITRPGGWLLIEVPNATCITARRHGWGWLHWDVPHHLHHFDSGLLAQWLQREGYRIHQTRWFSLEYGPYGIVQAWLNRLLPGPRHLLYQGLSGLQPRTTLLFLLHFCAAALLAPAAILLGLLRARQPGHGDIVTYLCQKNSR